MSSKKTTRKFYLIILISSFSNLTFSQWIEKNVGLYGGEVRNLVVQDKYLFAGTYGGLYRAADLGMTWEPSGSVLRGISIISLAVSKSVLFASTSKGLMISHDNGGSWDSSNKGLPLSRIAELAATDLCVFAKTFDNQLYRTLDLGKSWSKMNSSSEVRTIASADGRVYSTSPTGTYRTDDCGVTWIPILPNSNVYDLAASENYVIVRLDDGIYFSSDYGDSWKLLSITGSYKLSIASNGPTLIIGRQISTYQSMDSGQNWNLGETLKINSLVYSSGAFISGGYNGINYSIDNLNSWISSNKGMTNAGVWAITGSNTRLYALTSQGLFKSDDSGELWGNIDTDLPSKDIRAMIATDQHLIAALYTVGLFIYSDVSKQWQQVSPIKYISSFLKIGTRLLCGGNGGLYESLDYGLSWTKVLGSINYIDDLTSSEGRLFCLSENDFTRKIYTSLDGGKSWSSIYYNETESSYLLSLFAFKDKLFLGTGSKAAFRVDKFTQPWIPSISGMTENTSVITHFASNAKYIFAATNSGVYYSLTDGVTWLPLSRGTSNLDSIGYAENLFLIGEKLYLGTESNGVFLWSGCYPPERPKIFFEPLAKTIKSNQSEGNRWYINGDLLMNENSSEIKPLESGSYTVVVAKDGCETEPSNSIFISSDQIITSISEYNSKHIFLLISPNPVYDYLMINLELFEDDQPIILQMIDQTGRLLYKTVANNVQQQIDLRNFDNGFYIIRASQGKNLASSRFIKK